MPQRSFTRPAIRPPCNIFTQAQRPRLEKDIGRDGSDERQVSMCAANRITWTENVFSMPCAAALTAGTVLGPVRKASFGASLAPVDHRPDEVFAMGAAGPCNAREMQQDQEESRVGGKLVDLFERFTAVAFAILAVFIVVTVLLGPAWQACGCYDTDQRSLTFFDGQGSHARKRRDRQGEEQRHGHRPAYRAVAHMALRATIKKIAQIGENTARPGHEV